MAIFCKSYENALITVFWHAEFISALQMELKPVVFEKYAKKKKKKKILKVQNYKTLNWHHLAYFKSKKKKNLFYEFMGNSAQNNLQKL